jgi:hypothetical protein
VLTDLAEALFVSGPYPLDGDGAVLRVLSSETVVAVRRMANDNPRFRVSSRHRQWSGTLSGIGASVGKRPVNVFVAANKQVCDVLMEIDGNPFVIRTKHHEADVVLSAGSEFSDLDETIARADRLTQRFCEWGPLMMFLRGALGTRIWHNDSPLACFIIDDPLLKMRYGFVDYRRLVETIRKRNASACIAFIPWNYRRSARDAAALVADKSGATSLCIHGCDHTSGEFEESDLTSLRGRSQLALRRMREHHRLFGVPFDDVMVFPQGLFSVQALSSLKSAGYLAAVNSSVIPSSGGESVTLRDLMDVAVTKFADFPLFGRHYPDQVSALAIDLFLGKPALAVEHHGFFRHGYQPLEEFVERLHEIEPQLQWTNLGTICTRAFVKRHVSEREIHVRFFTSRFTFTNCGAHTCEFVLCRRLSEDTASPVVTVNGRERECRILDGQLRITVCLKPNETVAVNLESPHTPLVESSWERTSVYNARVWIRRHLCEIRDDFIQTNRTLRAIAAKRRPAAWSRFSS